ncbi:MAG: DNA-directed RNA polymerase subunit alpha C-terminal domain-containing protein [Xanthobacteraceae bacterium]
MEVTSVDLGRLDLSTRTRNCMIQANIETAGELATFTQDDILRIPNAGRKTLKEVREVLGSLGLKLRGDTQPAAPLNPKLIGELQVQVPAAPELEATTITLESAAPDIQRRLSTRLSHCSASVRAKGVFKSKKLIYIGDLVQLTFRALMKVDNAGRRTANELSNLARSYGFELGTPIVGWCQESAERLEKDYASEHARERVESSNALLASLGPEPKYLEQELDRIVLTLVTGRNHSMLVSLWGWDGNEPKTLEAVGDAQAPRLTRERVRQIEAKALQRLCTFKFDTPILRSAIVTIRKCVPALGVEVDQALQHAGTCSGPFSVASIKRAADILGIDWAFAEVTISGQRIVVRREDEDRIVRLMQVIRRRTSELGCSNIVAVASALKIEEGKIDILRKVLDVTPGICWLDEDKIWFFLKGAPRNRLFNLSAKVLGVSPRLSVPELRRAVSKSRRLTIAPPQKVLAAFVGAIGLGRVEDNTVVADSMKVAALSPESIEGKFVEVFRKYGNVMHGEELAERCVEEGVNPISFYIYRLISPVVTSLGRGVYCKVGADVPPGTIEEILSRRKSTTRSSDHGWLPNGNLWFGFEMTRIVLTSGSVRLVSFVSNLVQGDWTVRLADGQPSGGVTCRESFIWSFRKAFGTAGIEPEDFIALEFDKKAREVRVKTGGPDLFEAIQHEENGSAGDDLEGKDIETIATDANPFTNNDLTGDDKEWYPISIAPAERDLQLRLEDSFGRYVLLFPCRFLPGQGWINSRLETPLPAIPVDWRHWDETSIRL